MSRMRSAPDTSPSRRGTSARRAWSQLVSMKATKCSRAWAKLVIASAARISMVRWVSSVAASSSPRPAVPRLATWSSSEASTYSSAPAISSSRSSSMLPCCSTTPTRVLRWSRINSRAPSRPIIARVSATAPSSLTWVCRAELWAPVRRCRSSASLIRSSSSLTTPPTVASSSRLRPASEPRACSSSSALTSEASGPRASSTASLSPSAPRAARISLSRGSSTIGMSR